MKNNTKSQKAAKVLLPTIAVRAEFGNQNIVETHLPLKRTTSTVKNVALLLRAKYPMIYKAVVEMPSGVYQLSWTYNNHRTTLHVAEIEEVAYLAASPA